MGIIYFTWVIDWLLYAVIIAIAVNALTHKAILLQSFWRQVSLVVAILVLTDLYWLPATYAADVTVMFGNPDMAELLGESITGVELMQPDLLDIPLLIIQGLFGVYVGQKLVNVFNQPPNH